MRFTFFRRRKKTAPELGKDGLPADRITWKDSFEMQQLYKVSARTLLRWRDENDIDVYKFKKQVYYNNEQASKLFKKGERKPKKEQLLPWPFNWFLSGLVIALLAIFMFSGSLHLATYNLIVVGVILFFVGVVLLIQKIRKRPKI